jgi:MtN3 and saliva related transmembrane protein
MEQGLFYEVSGMLASVAMILGYLPQAIQTIRTRNTDGIAMPTFIMMFVGAIFFVIQALLHEPEVIWSLFLTNAVTGTCSLIVFVIKIYNDYSKKK